MDIVLRFRAIAKFPTPWRARSVGNWKFPRLESIGPDASIAKILSSPISPWVKRESSYGSTGFGTPIESTTSSRPSACENWVSWTNDPALNKVERGQHGYLTRTSFMMRPEMFQSCTYRLPSLSQ